ncbi:TPA: excinuclease ABC subunit UvrB [Candidatus Gastranaerophilales bacterium HUM_3]|jgi:excinuclease ABC subunit B|nr:uvrABC system protein B [Acinetobacter sp. CAG:196]DAA87276.1 MAG TPA: excinuclease ABC subunit UvrB [Candidatus Gastranaerophilales bacterium HUM_4]DAA87318.1 MAG TPA: excinuclease ABC subunit UvrB [Candidatus Gastranaerophilales bacterium HUM_3]DAA90072.1 MAG TPA: excinuclease ABC subunit UvrB [Candidatus Gastranaerophilales bacterium HUM_5]DAA95515.1 MAG TPA: excinuclease ABC subunit UvrB [Candidatus Gastranaerophilales bacterium HUM_8]DAB03584.1 MAG TPA: excinuclease ABC subunit UvrB [C
MERKFELVSKYKPAGDQPKAIEKLVKGIQEGDDTQTLLGITGSGKTFTIANVIEKVQKPTLIIAHNKTLAAQLYNEFKELFPNNAVEYFISYYDYYQPEAYIPRTDTYIEKSASINEEIDRLRHNTTRSLYERNDVIIVASVSCIYGLGLPESYFKGTIKVSVGDTLERNDLIKHLVMTQYTRNDLVLERSTFRARGDILEIMPAYEKIITRIYFFGDEVEKIVRIDNLTGEILEAPESVMIYPAVHYIAYDENEDETISMIRTELKNRVAELESQNKILESQRLQQRVKYDIEMIKEMGYCSGIENYSRIIERRPVGSAPATLLDYFRGDFLTVIDESHVTIPQLNGMYHGDASRKNTLVEFGFRLPCAKDNRPLKSEEFFAKVGQKIYISATPGEFEKKTSEQMVEQIIRPTGLVDPKISVRPIETQIPDLKAEIEKRAKKEERVLITTLTKKMAEDLCDFFLQEGIRVRYLHSGIKSIERVEILRDLRLGEFDVLIGVNLLREGLDIPEVSLVAIMDADKEGFLRSDTSLIQTIGRAARNACGEVIMYADKITDSMQRAIDETNRRREIQLAHNQKYGIIPQTIKKPIENNLLSLVASYRDLEDIVAEEMVDLGIEKKDLPKLISKLEKDMHKAAKILDFERAAEIRDQLKKLREMVN